MSAADSLDSFLLNCITVVMVNTTLPANIGSAARAMHTMGLNRLVLVAPKYPIDMQARANAAGGEHILNCAIVVNSIEDALKDSHLVFAASSRSRHLPKPVLTPEEAALYMHSFLQTQPKKAASLPVLPTVAILFGREDRGLTNQELALAQYHIQIPANPAYPVLNVASAVQVIASFIYAQFTKAKRPNASMPTILNNKQNILSTYVRHIWDEPAITQQMNEQLNHKLFNLMQTLDLADAKDPRQLPQRLRRLTDRVQLDQKEYQLIMATLAKLEKHLDSPPNKSC